MLFQGEYIPEKFGTRITKYFNKIIIMKNTVIITLTILLLAFNLQARNVVTMKDRLIQTKTDDLRIANECIYNNRRCPENIPMVLTKYAKKYRIIDNSFKL